MELITYSIENKNTFWVHLGFQICKLRIDLDNIYTNIGEFNFPQTHKFSKLFFSHIYPKKIIAHIISSLILILTEDYHNTLSDIQYNEQNIPFINIFLSITKFFVPEYNYTKNNSTIKQKSITTADFIFIQETFDKFEQLLIFITQEIISNSNCSQSLNSSKYKTKLYSDIKIINKKIIRLRNHSSQIDIRY